MSLIFAASVEGYAVVATDTMITDLASGDRRHGDKLHRTADGYAAICGIQDSLEPALAALREGATDADVAARVHGAGCVVDPDRLDGGAVAYYVRRGHDGRPVIQGVTCRGELKVAAARSGAWWLLTALTEAEELELAAMIAERITGGLPLHELLAALAEWTAWASERCEEISPVARVGVVPHDYGMAPLDLTLGTAGLLSALPLHDVAGGVPVDLEAIT